MSSRSDLTHLEEVSATFICALKGMRGGDRVRVDCQCRKVKRTGQRGSDVLKSEEMRSGGVLRMRTFGVWKRSCCFYTRAHRSDCFGTLKVQLDLTRCFPAFVYTTFIQFDASLSTSTRSPSL